MLLPWLAPRLVLWQGRPQAGRCLGEGGSEKTWRGWYQERQTGGVITISLQAGIMVYAP